MGRILIGASLVFMVAIIQFLTAWIVHEDLAHRGLESTGPTPNSFAKCSQDPDNETVETCEDFSKSSFFKTLAKVSFTGIPGAPFIVNAIYVALMGFGLSIGIILFVWGLIPSTSE